LHPFLPQPGDFQSALTLLTEFRTNFPNSSEGSIIPALMIRTIAEMGKIDTAIQLFLDMKSTRDIVQVSNSTIGFLVTAIAKTGLLCFCLSPVLPCCCYHCFFLAFFSCLLSSF
jgi:hypothetical protein